MRLSRRVWTCLYPTTLAPCEAGTARLRVGTPRTPFFDNLDPEIEKAVDTALDVLRRLTLSVQEVHVPTIAAIGASPIHRAIFGPEAFAYHSQWLAASPEKYQSPTRERLVAFSSPVTQQDYVRARHQCDVLRREIVKVFAAIDLLVTPTVAGPPSTIEPLTQHADLDPGRTRNAWPFAVYGLPAISVPCGFTTAGLPVGLQIIGRSVCRGHRSGTGACLRAGHRVAQTTPSSECGLGITTLFIDEMLDPDSHAQVATPFWCHVRSSWRALRGQHRMQPTARLCG